MIPQQIHFTIQTLLGETFQVSIPLTQAENIFLDNTSPYHYYGLDYLKDAICSSTGTDPVSQQLICQEELTIRTPLLPLVDTVITLIVKPSFTIEFTALPTENVVYMLLSTKDTPPAPISDWNDSSLSIICYLCDGLRTWFPQKQFKLRVIGQRRDYFKIAITDLHEVNELLRTSRSGRISTPYLITTNTPTYLWLHVDNDTMKIVETTQ
jgi:hypothetical protein